MRILLINAPPLKKAVFGEPQAVYPPLGILYLAAYLRERGYPKIRVIDGAKLGLNKTMEKLEKERADIVGISSTTWSCSGAAFLINFIKKRMENPLIVAGGPHATALPEYFLRNGADIVVRGEGEETFFEIVSYFERGVLFKELKNLKGISYLKDNKLFSTHPREPIDINSLPFPARDLIDIKKYPGLYWSKYQPETHIISSRGCPFSCFFCSNPVWRYAKPFYRLRNPENIREEMEVLKYRFGIKEVSDESDTFNINLKWAIDVCKEVGKVGIPWKVQIRADMVNREFARSLSDNNCWLVRVGIESGNQETLNGVGKMIDLKMVVRGLRKLKEFNVNVVGLFMGFNVWEKNGRLFYEDYKKSLNTLRFIKKLLKEKLIDSFSFTLTIPFPGSKLYETAVRFNLIVDTNFEKWNQSSYYVMKLLDVKEEEIERIKAFATYLQAKSMLSFKTSINPKLIRLYLQKLLLLIRLFKRW
jgi:magnesium-protoporphyrin IX monomethyl ester (oxidative) cyclase